MQYGILIQIINYIMIFIITVTPRLSELYNFLLPTFFWGGGFYMRATFLITSKVYFITLIDFFLKMRILNKAGFIFTFTKWGRHYLFFNWSRCAYFYLLQLMISITCTSQHFLFVWQSVGIENTMISASVNGFCLHALA